MLTYNTALLFEMKKQIQIEIERLKENLVTAYHIEKFDFSSYKHHVGKIEGLRRAIELLEEAEDVVNGKQ